METAKKVNSLVILRGIAVLFVCFCHFSLPLEKNSNAAGMFNIFHVYGKYGVLIFFVISGFIIPLSMDKAKYNIKYYFSFLFKRAIRLHPPYLIALALTLVIVALTNRVRHIPFPENLTSTIQSCFYLHTPANNPVFWSLQIEAEYYIFIGLFFVVLKSFPKLTLCIGVPLILFLGQFELFNYINLFKYIIPFFVGTIGYLIYNKAGSYLLEIICLISVIIFSFIFDSVPATLSIVFTISFILLYKGNGNRFFNFFGEISYSVYLLHFPIGMKLINLIEGHLNPRYNIVLFLLTIILVSAVSTIFWKLVEKPFGELSNKIRYGEAKKSPKSVAV